MWWKRKRLERLFDERAVALLNRLDDMNTHLLQNGFQACAKHETRQLELLAEIAHWNFAFDVATGHNTFDCVPSPRRCLKTTIVGSGEKHTPRKH